METGIIRSVIGPVVDVQFPAGRLPDIYNAIEAEVDGRKIVMECMQQLGETELAELAFERARELSKTPNKEKSE